MMVLPSRRVRMAGAMAMLLAIAVATLIPAGWQIRLGLHWLIEHFLAYLAVTAMFCVAWPKPMAVAAVLLPVAILLEAAQALTPDRVPDAATALSAATGVAVAALVADLVMAVRGHGRDGRGPGPSS